MFLKQIVFYFLYWFLIWLIHFVCKCQKQRQLQRCRPDWFRSTKTGRKYSSFCKNNHLFTKIVPDWLFLNWWLDWMLQLLCYFTSSIKCGLSMSSLCVCLPAVFMMHSLNVLHLCAHESSFISDFLNCDGFSLCRKWLSQTNQIILRTDSLRKQSAGTQNETQCHIFHFRGCLHLTLNLQGNSHPSMHWLNSAA